MHQSVKLLLGHGDMLFEQRRNLLGYWQEVAEHFYPERAHFTVLSYIGEEFAGNLSSGAPPACSA